MRENIEKALAQLQPALSADGFRLHLESVHPDGSVSVALEATPEACYDCLVPDAILVGILEQTIHDAEPSVGRVILNKLF